MHRLLAALALGAIACHPTVTIKLQPTTLARTAKAHYRVEGSAFLNDLHVTPGDVRTTDTALICHGSTKTIRNVPQSRKDSTYLLYGQPLKHPRGAYEVDHLISLELGGSNDLKNLWPQPAKPIPGFHEKDQLENELHLLICDGTLSAIEAQQAIATDWLSAYNKYVKGHPRAEQAPSDPDGSP